MKVLECKQGSAEWLSARAGRVTASRLADVVDFLKKGGESAARANYRMQIVAETLTGQCSDNFVNDAMRWGVEYEPLARAAYEMQTGNDVEQVGFIIHPSFERAGASPDGLIGKDGGLECKCPTTTTHIKWLLAGVVPEEHKPQMYFNMACAERDWWDFVSFDPRMPDHLQLFIARLKWDDAEIQKLESGVIQFLAEVDQTIAQLNALSPDPSPGSAPKKSKLADQLEASLGITAEEIDAIQREESVRLFGKTLTSPE